MRYQTIENITFVDINGISYNIKDMREYPEYTTKVIVKTSENDFIDEIATRKEIYGDNNENVSYKIYDHNIVKLREANWEMSNIKELNIPNP
jgi:hypothetical protein